MTWLIETPNQFSPRSEMLDFLKQSEQPEFKSDPTWQEAAAKVREMLSGSDAKGSASAKKKTR